MKITVYGEDIRENVRFYRDWREDFESLADCVLVNFFNCSKSKQSSVLDAYGREYGKGARQHLTKELESKNNSKTDLSFTIRRRLTKIVPHYFAQELKFHCYLHVYDVFSNIVVEVSVIDIIGKPEEFKLILDEAKELLTEYVYFPNVIIKELNWLKDEDLVEMIKARFKDDINTVTKNLPEVIDRINKSYNHALVEEIETETIAVIVSK